MIYFTSDLHFGHEKIANIRNFKTTKEMDDAIIKNWNKKVNKNDEVYILGDFTLSKDIVYINDILSKLNGKKHLIKGNHDYWIKKHKSISDYFVSVQDYYELKYNKRKFILFHYPMEEWKGSRQINDNYYHLYGHNHCSKQENILYKNKSINKYNVGLEANEYEPVSVNDILKFFKYK